MGERGAEGRKPEFTRSHSLYTWPKEDLGPSPLDHNLSMNIFRRERNALKGLLGRETVLDGESASQRRDSIDESFLTSLQGVRNWAWIAVPPFRGKNIRDYEN